MKTGLMISAIEILWKAGGHKYLRRWKGPKGTWRYAYRESSEKVEKKPVPEGAHRGTLRGVKPEDVKRIRKQFKRHLPGEGIEKSIQTKYDLDIILRHTTFALLSAGRNPENAEDMKLTDAQVKARHKSLLADLKAEGYVYTQCYGKYGNPEESIMLMTHDADRENVLDLGAKYNQDSVVFCSKGHNEMIFTTGPKKGGNTMEGSGYEVVPKADNYYTRMPVGTGGTIKFTMLLEDIKKAMEYLLFNTHVLKPTEFAKAKRMPIGTVSRGRKKVADGKWVPVPTGQKSPSKKTPEADTRSAAEKMRDAVRTGPKVNTFERKLLSEAVREAVPESYYKQIPIDEIDASLRKRGFLLLQEDSTPWAGMLLGAEGSTMFTIGRLAGTTQHDWGTTHQPIENAGLALSWYRDEKRSDRKYDVVAYAS